MLLILLRTECLMFGCTLLNMYLIQAEAGMPPIQVTITTPSPRRTDSGMSLAGGYSQIPSWFQLDFSVVKLRSHEPLQLSLSTVINDFCSCDLLAHAAEQWGIPGHGESPTHEPPGNELGLHLVLQLFTDVTCGPGPRECQPRVCFCFSLVLPLRCQNPRAQWVPVQPPDWGSLEEHQMGALVFQGLHVAAGGDVRCVIIVENSDGATNLIIVSF